MSSRILVFLEQTENRRLLSQWLEIHYQVTVGEAQVQARDALPLLAEPFDLCILDGVALDHLWEWVQARKKVEQPVFLPFLLITPYADVKLITRHLWQSVDELISKPIEKLELQARVEILLRSRQLSLQLKQTNEQLQNQIAQRQQAEAQREKAFHELQESEARFRRLVEFNMIGIMLADTSGKITEANDALLNTIGYTREDLLLDKIRWDKMTPPEYRFVDKQAISQMRMTKVCPPFEKEYIRKDGSRIHVLLGAVLLDGSQTDCVCFVLDITQHKLAEAEIRKALEQEKELNELKSSFVSMVSHEFRNPLNAISVSAQLLERFNDKWSQEKQSDFFRRIKTSVGRLTDLLDDILLLGKAEAGKLQFNPAPLNIENFCRNLVEEIKISTDNNYNITFVVHGQCKTPEMDENLLRHILTNLLSNAIKYSPANSTVHFELLCQDAVIFKIRDEGIGIPLEDQKQLFQSFHRAKNVGTIPGTGLGLAIVKQCVDVHGGAIAVASQVGIGTTFTVTLPLLL